MKFGHVFQEHLQHDGFPAHWVASAISYRQLKKCIKRVQRELADLGLDPTTLGQLLRTAEQERNERLAEYLLSNPKSSPGHPDAPVLFQPKLFIAVDDETGEPLDAHLSPLTRDYLQQLAIAQQLSHVRISDADTPPSTADQESGESSRGTPSDGTSSPDGQHRETRPHRMVELPLTSDLEFFSILQNEVSGLAALQAQEQEKLSKEVTALGTVVTRVTEPNRKSASKTDMAKWRKIFELYLESRIFFSTTELDHGKHDSTKAQALLQKFSDELKRQNVASTFKKKESSVALEQFLKLNMAVLQSLRFQEINDLAMQKILKKFDKRTALGVKSTFPAALQQSMPRDIAKAICYQVSTELLPIVPQLDDYLCPVCFSISYRPVRLRCQHIFCIRCLIVLQRTKEDHCPLCRGEVVMEADSGNLDPALADYLVKYFPDEVKLKQKENVKAAGVDQYGEAYNDKCVVM
ncbi:Zinc finger RING-type protein [Lasiodiplodia theobromae]|uniref:Putative RING finger protein n=1 Tax=Lasiodiplodia theobromae TaxID=45133 RepID=A0A5N5DET1_9PEZI|nr:putative RING finger protein [Lasiodiplodia theobromae]KAF9638243.1 Zinc finger RING-type protein [Lasiodiplodia theobromae]